MSVELSYKDKLILFSNPFIVKLFARKCNIDLMHKSTYFITMQDFKNFPNFSKFAGKNLMAIDYGEKVIGLASFTPGREPFPLGRGRIVNEGFEKFISQLTEIIEEDFVEVIIFGVPYLTDGTETDKSREMINKMNKLSEVFTDIEFHQQDETLTTEAAKERMLNSAQYNFQIDPKKIDEVSAIIILEDFISKT